MASTLALPPYLPRLGFGELLSSLSCSRACPITCQKSLTRSYFHPSLGAAKFNSFT